MQCGSYYAEGIRLLSGKSPHLPSANKSLPDVWQAIGQHHCRVFTPGKLADIPTSAKAHTTSGPEGKSNSVDSPSPSA